MDTTAINPYSPPCVGICGRAVDASNFGSGGPGYEPRPSSCFLRQGTLLYFVSLFPQVCKWVPKTYSLRWTSMPSWPSRRRGGGGGEGGGSSNTPSHASCQGVWYRLWPFGPGAHLYVFTWSYFSSLSICCLTQGNTALVLTTAATYFSRA